jgi:hypothetical protein
MKEIAIGVIACALIAFAAGVRAADKVIDIPTRPGVAQRFVLTSPPDAKAAVILFAGGHGGLQVTDSGSYGWGRGNFLVRSAPLFAARQLAVAVVDAPSDRQSYPYLLGFRQTPEHAADIRAVIAWLRQQLKMPVWLVGTSRGTQSAAAVALQLRGPEGPDGLVLTTTMFGDPRGRPVTDMSVETLKIPVLVVHHEQDECRYTLFRDAPRLMEKLTGTPRKELISFRGGESFGPPCEAQAYHGFRGLEPDVVARISDWILRK